MGGKCSQISKISSYKKLPFNYVPIDILNIRVEAVERGGAPGRFTPFVFAWLGVDWDVVTKKVLDGNEAPEETAQGEPDAARDEITGQAVEATASTEEESKKENDEPVECIHEYTNAKFLERYPKICGKLLDKAEEGSLPEIRLLLKIGKFDDAKAAQQRDGKSLGEILLDELKRRQDEREAAAESAKAEAQMTLTNEAASEGATSGGDAENG